MLSGTLRLCFSIYFGKILGKEVSTRLILAFINSTTSTSYHLLHCHVLSYFVAQQHRPKIAFAHKIAAPLFIHSLLSCYLIDLNVLVWMFFTPYTACVENDTVGFTNSLEMSKEEEHSSQMMHFSYTSTVLFN